MVTETVKRKSVAEALKLTIEDYLSKSKGG